MMFFRVIALSAGALLAVGCRPSVEIVRAPDFITYRARDVRVYFSPIFLQTLGYGTPQEETQHYQEQLATVGSLFERGLLTGEMFYRAARLAPYKRRSSHSRDGASPHTLSSTLEADPGPLLKVLFHFVYAPPSEPTVRNISLKATSRSDEDGWGSYDFYTVKLKNPRADATTPAAVFSAGATVLAVEYRGTEL